MSAHLANHVCECALLAALPQSMCTSHPQTHSMYLTPSYPHLHPTTPTHTHPSHPHQPTHHRPNPPGPMHFQCVFCHVTLCRSDIADYMFQALVANDHVLLCYDAVMS